MLLVIILFSLFLLINCDDIFDDSSSGGSKSSSNPLIYDAIAVGNPTDTVEKTSFTVGETIYINHKFSRRQRNLSRRNYVFQFNLSNS